MPPEDQRTAAGMTVTLSSQLIAAALGMLALEGAYVAFVLGTRVVAPWFGLIAVVSGSCFIASIFVAGKGITKVRDGGFDGQWSITEGKGLFNSQAILCLLGLALFLFAILWRGKPVENSVQQSLDRLNRRLSAIEGLVDLHERSRQDVQKELERLRLEIVKPPDRRLAH
jgi:hypothetical protein